MKRHWTLVYTDSFTFGGFKEDKNRLFFLLPCIRICVVHYQPGVCFSTTIGFGILFWEFVRTFEWQK